MIIFSKLKKVHVKYTKMTFQKNMYVWKLESENKSICMTVKKMIHKQVSPELISEGLFSSHY